MARNGRKPMNPFVPATPVAKKLKVLLYGPSGSGKTLAALSFPKVAYISAEGGADLYAGREGIQPFHWFATKTITGLEQALDFIEADHGETFETLVIDPITVFYDVLKDATEKGARIDQLGFREWAQINRRMKAAYNRLTNLQVHVVVIARESTDYEGQGNNLKRVGVKPDADKSLAYVFDFIIHMDDKHAGIIEKSRGLVLGDNGKLPKVDWSALEPASDSFATGTTQEQQSEGEAAEEEAEALVRLTEAEAGTLVQRWRGEGLSNNDILKALNVGRMSEYQGNYETADKAIQDWIADQLQEGEGQESEQPETATDEATGLTDDEWSNLILEFIDEPAFHTNEDLLKAMGVDSREAWTGGYEAAVAHVQALIDQREATTESK